MLPNKRQQEEPPVGLEAGSQLKSQGKWLGVGGTFLWDFTYLCWNLTIMQNLSTTVPDQDRIDYELKIKTNKEHFGGLVFDPTGSFALAVGLSAFGIKRINHHAGF